MTEFEQLQKLIDSDTVKYGVSLPKLLHKKLCLGQTRYVCRYGTLSDGHEKITPAQRYYQAIREMYYICLNITDQRANAMLAQADLLEAQELLSKADTASQKLRAEAACIKAKSRLTSSLVTVQDQLRMVDEYDKVRRELEHEVDTKYPEGIEQAEPDNWKAIFEYRVQKGQTPGLAPGLIDSIPLEPSLKAQLGFKHGRFDAILPLALTDPAKVKGLESKILQEQKLLQESN